LKDSISKYKLQSFIRTGSNSRKEDRPNLYYPIYINKITLECSIEKVKGWEEVFPIDSEGNNRVWRWGKDTTKNNLSTEFVVKFSKNKYNIFSKKRLLEKAGEGYKPKTFWNEPKYNASSWGTILLQSILGKDNTFDYPKSLYAVIDSLIISTKRDSTILDFFAGSGTTGHAVLELNKQDGGNRKFILCTNNENNICEEVTYERIKRVIKGYKNKKGEKVNELGGNLSYYKTDLVNIDKLHKISDEAKIKVTYQAGEMIAVREDTLNEIEKNDWWQIFEGNNKITAIYFKEDKAKIKELIKKLISKIENEKTSVTLYIFGWGKNEYKNEYSSGLIRVEDIPEPILEVYKEINRL